MTSVKMVTDTWMTTLSTPDTLDNNDTYDYFSEWCAYTNPQLSISSYFTLVFTILGLIGKRLLTFCNSSASVSSQLTNMLVVNLAASDILLFVTTTPFFVEADIHPCWQFGTTGCKFTNMIWVVLHSVCMFTLAALAVERYCAVTSRAGFRSKTCALGSIWLFRSSVSSACSHNCSYALRRCVHGVCKRCWIHSGLYNLPCVCDLCVSTDNHWIFLHPHGS